MSQRLDRLADQIQKDLSGLIRDELKDPRVGMVTISGVRVSKDLGYADIYVTVLGATLDEGHEASIKALNGASGFLRTALAKGLRLRTVPRLRFHYDDVVARGNRLTSLITEAVREDEQRAARQSDDEQS